MGIDSENALEKFDDLVKGCDYDGVHTMIANLQTPAARTRAKGRHAFRMLLPPFLTLPHTGGADTQRTGRAWIAS